MGIGSEKGCQWEWQYSGGAPVRGKAWLGWERQFAKVEREKSSRTDKVPGDGQSAEWRAPHW